jgi:hypothetical protein
MNTKENNNLPFKTNLNHVNVLYFIYLFINGTGVGIQGLALARQAVYHLSHASLM